jgi:hypothetical protein
MACITRWRISVIAPARYLLICTPAGFGQRFGPDAKNTPPGPNTDVIVVGPRIADDEDAQ